MLHRKHILISIVVAVSLLLSACKSEYDQKVNLERMKSDFLYWSGLGDYSKLDAAANAFLNGTNECILDVRDRSITYKQSKYCAALETLSASYLDAGGNASHGDEPSIIYAKGQEALKYVWMARAISELGGGMQNAWVW